MSIHSACAEIYIIGDEAPQGTTKPLAEPIDAGFGSGGCVKSMQPTQNCCSLCLCGCGTIGTGNCKEMIKHLEKLLVVSAMGRLKGRAAVTRRTGVLHANLGSLEAKAGQDFLLDLAARRFAKALRHCFSAGLPGEPVLPVPVDGSTLSWGEHVPNTSWTCSVRAGTRLN